MRYLFLIFVWITPAFIAGILGWKGIWGTGDALFEYLIPLPVAGGVLHVPSFILAAAVILNLKKIPGVMARFIPLAAVAMLVAAQTLQLDFDRLNAWFFTDYEPYKSAFRFGDNPVYLFLATDAFWVAVYALINGCAAPLRYWLLLPLLPATLIGFQALKYKIAGPEFIYGFSSDGKTRGEQIITVYSANRYDEKMFRDWLEKDTSIVKPWESQNAEHVAVLFSRSMQAIKMRNPSDIQDIVATACLYEEDRSMTIHVGYHDCFAGRLNLAERLEESLKATQTGLGREVDDWYAGARLCEGVDVPERFAGDIAIIDLCRRLKWDYPGLLRRFTAHYGADGPETVFLRSNANLLGLTAGGEGKAGPD